MKKIMSSSMVAHTWMHQTQDEARNAGGTLFFRGRTIYSYGAHFPIATIHKKEDFNDTGAMNVWLNAVAERVKHQEEKAKTQHIRDAQNRARREAEAAKKAEEQIKEWLAGSVSHFYGYGLPVHLRLKPNDAETVQTSRGAEIPLRHAQLLWEKVKQAKGHGKTYVRNGHTVYAGTFAVESIDEAGTLTAGCHTIHFAAMEDFARRLGW